MYAERSTGIVTGPNAPRAAAPAGLLPRIAIRGRSVLALVIAPENPFEHWFAALDLQLCEAPDFFAGRPVIVDLGGANDADEGLAGLVEALDRLSDRRLKLIGVEGIDPDVLSGTRWARLPTIPQGREQARAAPRAAPAPAAVEAPPAAPRTLLIDHPLRSGQSVSFDGDVTIVGAVGSGAEVIAGGSIHVYGALRGRAIAGASVGETARIFCRRLEAELIAVAGFYRIADDWAELQGRPAQVRCEGRSLKFMPLGE